MRIVHAPALAIADATFIIAATVPVTTCAAVDPALSSF
jgi:hypothetical protein